MSSPLKIKLFQVFFLVCVILFLASVAQAGSTHHHHQGKPDVISPFEKVGEPLHCILNLHEHFQRNFCPHQKRGANDNAELRADCGGTSSSAIPANASFAKEFSSKTINYGAPSLFVWWVDLPINNKLLNLPRAIDLPPQLTWTILTGCIIHFPLDFAISERGCFECGFSCYKFIKPPVF